jgi:hypothetical protein
MRIGVNFGASGAVVLVGNFLCADAVHDPFTPHSKLTCTLPSGTRLNLPIIMMQGGVAAVGTVSLSYALCQVRVSFAISYVLPRVTDLFSLFFCQPGFYASGLLCLPCGSGAASTTQEAQSCTTCLAGTVSGPAPSSQCVQCTAGKFSGSGWSACANCTVGTAGPDAGQSDCPLCPQGSYSAVNGSTVCTPCSPGYHQSALGASACDLCTVGSASTVSGRRLCDGKRCSLLPFCSRSCVVCFAFV